MPSKRAKLKKLGNLISKEDNAVICIGEKNIVNWKFLKEKLHFKLDCDFVEYLLSIAEQYVSSNRNFVYNNGVSSTDELSTPPNTESTKVVFPKINGCDISNNFDNTQKSTEPLKATKLTIFKKMKKNKKAKLNSESVANVLNGNRGGLVNESSTCCNLEAQNNKKFCRICDNVHNDEYCTLFFPKNYILDCVNKKDWIGDEGYSFASLPCELKIREERVFSSVHIPYGTRLGPLVGRSISEPEIPDDSNMEQIWELSEGKYISTDDVLSSNWMRWVRPAPSRERRNLVVLTTNDLLYFVSIKEVNPDDELLYWAEPSPPWSYKNMDKTSCGGCNITFSSPMGYRLHCSIFHEPTLSLTVRKYHCKVCAEPILGKQNIINHAAKVHGGKGAYQCQFCSKFFLRLNYLEMHKNYGCPSNPHRSRPLCHHCGKKFCQPQKLKIHIKRMHSDAPEALREFQCSSCLKLLGSRVALHRHLREVHKKASGLSCEQCGKLFQNRSNLKIHMLTHSGVKPFKCLKNGCNSAFTTKQCLQFHYKKVHGLSDCEFPEIERSVDYTIIAYSGEKTCDSNQDVTTEEEKGREKSIGEMPVLSKASRKWMGEDLNVQVENGNKLEEVTPYLFRNDIANASLLVEAAIESAEKDIGPVYVSTISSLRLTDLEQKNITEEAENLSMKGGTDSDYQNCYFAPSFPEQNLNIYNCY